MAAKKATPTKDDQKPQESQEKATPSQDDDVAGPMVTVTLSERASISPNGYDNATYQKGKQKMPIEHKNMIKKHFPDLISDK
jgi:hypothetical protein